MRNIFILWCLVVTGFFPPAAQSQEFFQASSTNVISLQDAIKMAFTNNLDLRIERINPLIERLRVKYALGAFDPSFRGGINYEDFQTPLNSREFVAIGAPTNSNARVFHEQNLRMEAGVIGLTPIGTSYGLTFRTAELRNPINRQIPPSLFYPEYSSFAGLTIEQPLLRNFGLNANLAELRFARKSVVMAEKQERQQLMASIASVMTNYYDLAFALENLKVKDETISLAREFERANRKRFEQGVMTSIDVQQAQVAVSVGQEELLSAQSYYIERQNALKRQIFTESTTSPDERIVPGDPLIGDVPKMRREDLVREGFENRPDYQAAIILSEREDIRLKYARNQVLPRLDLVGTFGVNGLGGDYAESYERIFDEQGPVWTVGVQVTIPFGNLQAKSLLGMARYRKEQAILNIKRLEMAVILDVDTAVSRLESSRQRIDSSRHTRLLAEETLKIEMRRLEQGQTSSFNVLQFQRDLSQARTRELQAIADLNKSVVLLRLATGTLLLREGFVLQEQP